MKVLININGNQFILNMGANQKLSDNFTLKELANNEGDDNLPKYEINCDSMKFVFMLQAFRECIGAPVYVNSGYRQAEYNKKVGGDSKSAHLRGWAADIKKISGVSDEKIISVWRALCLANWEVGAINIYKNYYHLEINSDLCYGATSFTIRRKDR